MKDTFQKYQRFYAHATVSDIVLREEAIYASDPLINRTNIEQNISSVSTFGNKSRIQLPDVGINRYN